jgi:3-oxoacyl-[acyl-carrier protein] reductase
MDLGIKHRLALVTGCSRGIGRAIAAALASEGAKVILVARSADALEALRRELPSPESHVVVAVDLMADSGIAALAEKIGGLGDLDIMVHNLGGSAGVTQTLASNDDWRKVWQFNVGIGHELNRLFVPKMAKRRWGRVVHLSTLSTVTFKGYSAYVSAKCALDGYVKCLGREMAKDNVIVSSVAPGAIRVEGRYLAKLADENPSAIEDYFKNNLPTFRLGTTREIADMVAYLCSEKAGFMAGARVALDGGGI